MAIRIDIASEFKDKGFKQAEKATGGLQGSLKNLGKTLVGVLSVREIYQFGKASVKAFEEDQRAATRLTQALGNLGLGFEDSRVKGFLSDLEATSGVLDDKLRPAFQSLLTTTGSVSKSQELLGLALDVAAGSGEDVVSVASDLSKAYTGNTRSLAKYNTGLTKAELQTASFADIQALLAKQFAGQNAAYLDTYSGKVAILNVAYANMQETIGKGLVDAFQILSGNQGIGGGVSAMDTFGDAVADTTRGVAMLVSAFKDLNTYGSTALDLLRNIDPFNPLGSAFGYVRNMGKPKPAPFRTPMTISGSTDAQTKIDAARKKAEAEAAKRAKELLALTKKQVKAQEALNKKKKEEGILGQISQRFDLERIQIAAALGGQINEVERIRLELMQAILDEDVKRAIILEGQLIKAEAAAADLALLLDSLDELVGDPFTDWPATITKIQGLLNQLNIKIPIETLFAEKGLKLDQKTMTVTTIERMDVDANNVYINGTLNNATQPPSMPGGSALPVLPKDWESNPILAPAVNAAADASAAEAEAAAALALLEAEAAAAALAAYENDQALKALFAQLGLDESGNPINVNVVVEGSIISQNDLVEQITDDIYRIQKTGKRITLSSIDI
jgi:phage terminase Nu1 subunit (DNA packaging protein)